jgi:hypothetical protein
MRGSSSWCDPLAVLDDAVLGIGLSQTTVTGACTYSPRAKSHCEAQRIGGSSWYRRRIEVV